MDSSHVVDMWNTFKDSIDKKTIETTAESICRYMCRLWC